MAKLATLLNKLDEVAEPLREFYEPVDANDENAGFQLATDNSDDKSRRNDFRSNNIELMKQVKVLEGKLSKFDGLPLEGLHDRLQGLDKLVAAAKTAEEKQAIESGDVETLVQRRTAEALSGADSKFTALETVNAALTGERDQLRQRVGRSAVQDAVMTALGESKTRVRSGALDDLMRRAHETWSVDGDDHLVAKERGEPVYGEGGRPMAMGEWTGKLASSATHLFEQASGGGSPGSRGSRVVDTRGKRGVDFQDPMAIGKNLDDLLKKNAVLVNTPE